MLEKIVLSLLLLHTSGWILANVGARYLMEINAGNDIGAHIPLLFPGGSNLSSTNSDTDVNYYAGFSTDDGSSLMGAKASLDVYAVGDITADQATGAVLWITGDPSSGDHDTIGVAWLVSRDLYPDDKPRLTLYYHAKGGPACYNSDKKCGGGYVQTHESLAPGMELEASSSIVGRKYITLLVELDPGTQEWSLSVGFGAGNVPMTRIGHWKKGFFGSMATSCSKVMAAGFASSPADVPSPKMGNGMPGSDIDNAALVQNIWLLDHNHAFVNPVDWFTRKYRRSAPAYEISALYNAVDRPTEFHFYYGGSGHVTS